MLTLLPFTGLSIAAYLLWALVAAWMVSLVLTIYGLSRQSSLLPFNDSALQSDKALVSIIVPARNE
jgi:hypothetical protein